MERFQQGRIRQPRIQPPRIQQPRIQQPCIQRACIQQALILLAATLLCLQSTSAAPPKHVTTVEGISEYQLENGVKLLLFPDMSSPRVTVNLTVLVGSRHEGYGETGMAHLLEHMVFKGTPTFPNVPKSLQDHGAQFNGTTWTDRTNYFETLNATDENLEFAIRLEADRMMNSFIKKEDLESEFTVVRNEFERGENSPMNILFQRIQAAAYEWHNYGKSTIGNRSDIERVPIDNLRSFYQRFYQPDNVVLIVAGQFREPRVLELVEKHFGTIPRPTRKLQNTYTEEPPQDGERTVILRRVGEVGAVGLGYHIPAGTHEDIAPLQVLANSLDNNPSGRLYRALVVSEKATRVGADATPQHDPGLMTFDVMVRDPKKLEEVRDIVIKVLDETAEKGLTDEEIGRSKQQILKDRELSFSNTSRIAVALSEWVALGDWRLFFLHRDRIEQVTNQDIQRVAKRYFDRSNRTVGLFIPTEKPERVSIPSAPDATSLVASYQGRKAIVEGEVFESTPENIEARVQRLVLPGGIKVSLLPKKSRGEEVHLTLTLRYGNEENLRGFETAASFLGPLMVRGTQKLSFQQLQDELDKLTATLSSGGGGRGRRGGGGPPSLGSVGFSIQAKRETFPKVLQLLTQVLREPLLPADQFEIMKRERLAGLEQSRSEPDALSLNALQRTFAQFPSNDVRYVPTIDESIERLQSTTYDHVVRLYREFIGGTAGELSIVGDFQPQECLPILREALSNWEPRQSYARIPSVLPKDVNTAKQQVNTPDKANATYVAGTVFPLRDDDPEYTAMTIANFIYGGGSLASRLGTRVRQQEGLSYGVSSTLGASSFERRASLVTNAISNPQNIAKVDAAIREELDRFLREGPTEKEVEEAKQSFLQFMKISRASDSILAGILATSDYEGRTMQFHADREKQVSNLTADKVSEAFRKFVDPKKIVVIFAGDFGAAKP